MMNSQTSAKICLHICCWMFLSYWMFQKRTVTKKFFNGIQSPSSSTSNRGNFLPDLLAALMPPYLRALLGTRQERALLIERASITIKTFINECNVKEMIIFLRLIKRTMLNWRGICQKKKKCQGTDARKQTQFRANSASNQMVFQNLWHSIWSQSVGVLWSALHFPFSRTNFQ